MSTIHRRRARRFTTALAPVLAATLLAVAFSGAASGPTATSASATASDVAGVADVADVADVAGVADVADVAGVAATPLAARRARWAMSPRDKVRAAVRGARYGMEIPDRTQPPLSRLDDDLGDVQGCDYADDVRKLCPRGDTKDPERTVVLLGDSHGRFWIPAFERLGWMHDWRAYYLVKEQCTAAYLTPAKVGSGRPFTECTDFHDWAREQVRRIRPDLVVVASSSPSGGVYINGERVRARDRVAAEFQRGHGRLFRAIKPLPGRVALIRDVPRSKTDPETCLSNRHNDLGDCLFKPTAPAEQMTRASIRAARYNGVPVVNAKRWVCWDNTCPVVISNRLISYRDQGHLTGTWSRRLSEVLARDLGMR
jgi:hypothetical protein